MTSLNAAQLQRVCMFIDDLLDADVDR
jgi:hypothetical protein